jgi:hypothetical protein
MGVLLVAETAYPLRPPEFTPSFLVVSVLLIFLVLCVVLWCVFAFCDPCCDVCCNFGMITMIGLSLPPFVSGRMHFFCLRCLCLFMYSGVQHIVLYFCFRLSSSCVPCVASFSWLFFFLLLLRYSLTFIIQLSFDLRVIFSVSMDRTDHYAENY